MADTVVYGIDAGGTHTRICLQTPGAPIIRKELGSISRASVGQAAAQDCLRATFEIVAAAAAGRPSVGWLAAASIVTETVHGEIAAICKLLPAGSRLLAVSNDAVPMLFAPPLADRGIVVIAGTGSGFLGGDGNTVLALGNHEYLGSDQGSAFDIGLQGLRAALRTRDGIGPPSTLPEALSRQAGADIASEARRLAALPFPKQAVARLAPVVVRCWLARDKVAESVMNAAIEALAAAAAELRRALRLTRADGTVLGGGVLTGCPEFAASLRAALGRSCGPHEVTVCTDAAATVLSCARRLAGADDRSRIGEAYLNRHVWLARAADER